MSSLLSKFLLLSSVMCFLSNAASEKPPVLFLETHLNYAWGYMHYGWLIDASGAIRSFTFTYGDSMQYPNGTDTIPLRIYNRILPKSIPTGKKVSTDTLLSMQTLIESASRGAIASGGACMDAGSIRYSAFMYDSFNSRYKELICYQVGDAWICNSAPAAKTIARWLISLDSLPIRLCTPPDSCLNSTSISSHLNPLLLGKTRPPSSATFYLNGKKAYYRTRQITARKNKIAPFEKDYLRK